MARFTAGEMEVMRILWEHGELKPAEIQKHFPRPIKNAALRSYLTILVEKGHLMRRGKGKAFYYRPKTKRESTFRSMLGELVNTFCGGSSEALLCHLLAKEKLSPEELLELQRMAQQQPAASSEPRLLRFLQENQAVNALLMAFGGLQPIVDAPVWVVLLLKITAILLAAWLAHLALERANPRWRVFLWRVTAVGLIALPAVAWLFRRCKSACSSLRRPRKRQPFPRRPRLRWPIGPWPTCTDRLVR